MELYQCFLNVKQHQICIGVLIYPLLGANGRYPATLPTTQSDPYLVLAETSPLISGFLFLSSVNDCLSGNLFVYLLQLVFRTKLAVRDTYVKLI